MIFLFDKGADENKKLNPQQGALLMAQHLEPLESTQIQSFWSRYHKKKNTQTYISTSNRIEYIFFPTNSCYFNQLIS